ncbi:hypothetical protein Nepgr_033806 [Nepenthes gracilis]|uniref:Uncharacterized protein n=1 Tax=Nepenthes gracilis TaxID=150966 RepID=A0AAD3Y6X1_NEPGR|nr:hypothetical protein Nepgr_033806 [Nepenthes gracilis]
MGMETSDAVRTTKRGKVDNWLGGGEEIKFFMVYAELDAITRENRLEERSRVRRLAAEGDWEGAEGGRDLGREATESSGLPNLSLPTVMPGVLALRCSLSQISGVQALRYFLSRPPGNKHSRIFISQLLGQFLSGIFLSQLLAEALRTQILSGFISHIYPQKISGDFSQQSSTKLSEDLSQQHEAFRCSSHIFPHKISGDLSQFRLEALWRFLSASLIALRRPLPTSLRSSSEISHSFPQKLSGDLSQFLLAQRLARFSYQVFGIFLTALQNFPRSSPTLQLSEAL